MKAHHAAHDSHHLELSHPEDSSGPEETWRLAPYAIGTLAAFWTIDRLVTVVTRSF